MKNVEKIRKNLLNSGFNYLLVMSMSDNELIRSTEIEEYEDYVNYMDYLARKYDI